jgi:hypothetical protein
MKALAAVTLAAHLAFIVWVIFGALVAHGRRRLRALHVASLIYSLIIEIGPWPCPLTLAEQYFESRAGIAPYHGGFLVHYLDALVYPNAPGWLLSTGAALVLIANLAVYWAPSMFLPSDFFGRPCDSNAARHHFGRCRVRRP